MQYFINPIEIKALSFAAITAVASQTALANVIYEPTDLGGGSWQYDFEVINTQAFQVHGVRLVMPHHPSFPTFPDSGFSNLTEVGAPDGNWFSTVTFEVPGLFAQSYWVLNDRNQGVPAGFDAVLDPGETLTGISLTFDWVGEGDVPPDFDWEFVFLDPATGGTFEVVAGGESREEGTPAPGTLALLALGLIGAGFRRYFA